MFYIDHVHIYSNNVQDTVDFYTRVLGATELRRFGDNDSLLVHLQLGGARLVVSDSTEANPRGLNHYALSVSDLNNARSILEQNGIEIIRCGSMSNFNNLFFRDPNGVLVELISPSTQPE